MGWGGARVAAGSPIRRLVQECACERVVTWAREAAVQRVK